MNRDQLSRYVGITGYSLGHVEKDYFQHIILSTLSREMAGTFIFKGGTALQKTGVIPRFSEDLDFTQIEPFQGRYLERIAVQSIEDRNFNVITDRHLNDERTTGLRLKIEGPLFRNGRGSCAIRIEVSKRETIMRPPENIELDPPYPDILPYVMNVMNKEEMLAEKVRTIYTRQKARDLYDLYRLSLIGAPLNIQLANKKLAYYSLSFEDAEFQNRCMRLQKGWNNELEALMIHVPAFEDVMNSIRKMKQQ
jgi:predicted nucleotidyltransferase component of viral defense system